MPETKTANSELVRAETVTKRFGGVTALDKVSVTINRGEIHALVGENGAGKSTLMKILAGVYRPDEGQLFYKGQAVQFVNPRVAQQAGVSIVFQELNLFPDLTVAGNIFLNREPQLRSGLMNEKYMRQRSREILSSMGVEIDPRVRVGRLPIGEQQMVEIAGALSQDSELIIMDEPNSALTDRETERLFEILNRLKDRGITIIYVSHRLEEVFSIADRISVLRDGHYIGTKNTAETIMPEVISMMTGRQLSEVFPERPPLDTTRETLLEVKDLAQKGRLEPLSFALRRGEILGFAGLEGCGKEQIFHMLFGLNPEGAGQVRYQDRSVNIKHPSNAIDLGWGLIPANRRDEGIILDWSILDNTTLVILNRLKSQLGLVNRRQARRTVNRFVDRLNIVTDNLRKRVINLSGGNQQKVVLAKWLATDPTLLILNDPTRGVDVGSKVEIYNLVHDLAEAGLGILFTSSELDEILGLCDRIIVLYKGRNVFECRRGEATKQEVLQYVNGSGSGIDSLKG